MLSRINLHLDPGEIVAVVGAQRLGQTAPLRVLAGLERVLGGTSL